MPNRHAHRPAVFGLLAGLAALLAGCSSDGPKPDPMKFGQTVRGKVTYNGQPVPYGAVLFYHHQNSLDAKTGTFAPSAVGYIDENGRYEMTNLAAGPVMVCVATDPDADLLALTQPTAPGELPGVIPGKPGNGPPSHPPTVLPERPADAPPTGLPGMPPGGPPGGLPMPPMPPLPPGAPPMPKMGLPGTENLTAEQKKLLKEIHAKYGSLGKSPLHLAVEEGEQTLDIPLK
jgi:hypothetical protein